MIYNILKKDLKRKKTMNIIVLLFIIISVVFLASSVNNLVTTNNALAYFAGQTNVADYFLLSAGTDDVKTWAAGNEYVNAMAKEELIMVEENNLRVNGKKYNIKTTNTLCKVPQQYNLITDRNDQVINRLSPGEIALTYVEALENEVQVGDVITIHMGKVKKECKVAYITKDMAFGTSYMGFSRMVISDEDYNDLKAADVNLWNLYSFITDEPQALAKSINQENFMGMFMFDREMLNNTYILDMMIFSILIIVGICLILMAFIVLRFTIIFTLQEDYKEIGIMKAVGLKDFDIKKLYLVKYIFMAVVGALIGFVLSFPFGEVFMQTVRLQLVIEPAAGNIALSALCAFLVVILVALFCYFSTGKVNRYTAIGAIRNGADGERYQHKKGISLNRRRKLPAVIYLAFNDILSHVRSYVILIMVFTLGTLLVILPNNASNTLKSDDSIELFAMRRTDVYIDNNHYSSYAGDTQAMERDVIELIKLYKERGIEIDIFAEKGYMGYVYTDGEEGKTAVNCIQSYRSDETEYLYLEGTPPVLANEIAMTGMTMERLGVEIGDSIEIEIGDELRQFLITASYQTMMQMGEQMRLAEAVPVKEEALTMMFNIQGQFKDRTDIAGQIDKLKAITPDYKIRDVKEYTDTMLDTIRDTMVTMKNIILVVVMAINALISVLMCKTLMTKDLGTIALLKSIGFRNGAVRRWQAVRILTVMILSLVLGALLSKPLNLMVGKLTFGMMGASVIEMEINAAQVYVLYPLMLLAATIAAVLVSTLNVNKIGLKELGNIE